MEFGLGIGLFHHFLVQYPLQADIFTTIYAFIGGNLAFLVAGLRLSDVSTTVDQFLVFVLTYVKPVSLVVELTPEVGDHYYV